jgi:hypothetical protein
VGWIEEEILNQKKVENEKIEKRRLADQRLLVVREQQNSAH